MFRLRWVISSCIYFLIVFLLLVIFRFKFSGITGCIELVIIAFASHSFVDHYFHKLFKKKKENDVHV